MFFYLFVCSRWHDKWPFTPLCHTLFLANRHPLAIRLVQSWNSGCFFFGLHIHTFVAFRFSACGPSNGVFLRGVKRGWNLSCWNHLQSWWIMRIPDAESGRVAQLILRVEHLGTPGKFSQQRKSEARLSQRFFMQPNVIPLFTFAGLCHTSALKKLWFCEDATKTTYLDHLAKGPLETSTKHPKPAPILQA